MVVLGTTLSTGFGAELSGDVFRRIISMRCFSVASSKTPTCWFACCATVCPAASIEMTSPSSLRVLWSLTKSAKLTMLNTPTVPRMRTDPPLPWNTLFKYA